MKPVIDVRKDAEPVRLSQVDMNVEDPASKNEVSQPVPVTLNKRLSSPKDEQQSPLQIKLHPVDDWNQLGNLQLTGPTQPTSNGNPSTRKLVQPPRQLTSLITLAQKLNSKKRRHSSKRLVSIRTPSFRDNSSISVTPFQAMSPNSGTDHRDHKTTQPLIKQIVS